MPKSLHEFTVEKKPVTTCTVCNAPDEVRMQVEANETAEQHARVARTLVVQWAKQEFGHHISVDSIARHNRDHVFL